MAGALDVTAVLGGAIGIVCWLVIAAACRRARSWTRIAGTVLLALNTASLLTVLLATHNDRRVKTASLLVWIIGLAATIPLWGRQASDFFLAWRKQPLDNCDRVGQRLADGLRSERLPASTRRRPLS